MRTITTLLFLFLASASWAHDVDCKGRPVPKDIKAGCCGKGDALSLPPGAAYEDEHGVWYALIDGQTIPIVNTHDGPVKPLPSDDACVWVWGRRQNSGGYYEEGSITSGHGAWQFYCLQVPMAM